MLNNWKKLAIVLIVIVVVVSICISSISLSTFEISEISHYNWNLVKGDKIIVAKPNSSNPIVTIKTAKKLKYSNKLDVFNVFKQLADKGYASYSTLNDGSDVYTINHKNASVKINITVNSTAWGPTCNLYKCKIN